MTKSKTSARKKSTRYTENWIPIKDITNGSIQLENNYKVTGVKIRPRNIFILGEDEQNNVLANLRNFYDTIDYEFWIICADRPVDISVYLSQLQLLYNSSSSPAVRKMIMEDVDKANMFMRNNVVDTEYYLLFREKDDEKIQKRIRQLVNGLAGAGLNAAQTSNEDLRVILDNFLNGGVSNEFGGVMPQ